MNDMQRLSVRRLTNACRDFFGKCVEFEKAWNENKESAFQMFNDEWRARKYVVLCHESLQKHKDTHQAAAKGCLPQYGSAPGSGKKARVFERYFVDVNDEALDYFIRFTQPISPRVKWLGSRAEAVIFAEEFGLTAKDMNRSFIIPSRSGVHRNLSLSGDTPKFAKNLYPIWKAISDYKSVL